MFFGESLRGSRILHFVEISILVSNFIRCRGLRNFIGVLFACYFYHDVTRFVFNNFVFWMFHFLEKVQICKSFDSKMVILGLIGPFLSLGSEEDSDPPEMRRLWPLLYRGHETEAHVVHSQEPAGRGRRVRREGRQSQGQGKGPQRRQRRGGERGGRTERPTGPGPLPTLPPPKRKTTALTCRRPLTSTVTGTTTGVRMIRRRRARNAKRIWPTGSSTWRWTTIRRSRRMTVSISSTNSSRWFH